MKNKSGLLLFFFGLLFTNISNSAPQEVTDLLAAKYKGAKTLVETACAIGPAKTEAIGFIIKDADKNADIPLHPVIAYKTDGKWTVFETDLYYSYDGGGGPNFLGGYWDRQEKKLKQDEKKTNMKISCSIPNTTKGLSTKLKGDFLAPFSKNLGPGFNHLCYLQDPWVKNWVCFSQEVDKKVPEMSFIQLRPSNL